MDFNNVRFILGLNRCIKLLNDRQCLILVCQAYNPLMVEEVIGEQKEVVSVPNARCKNVSIEINVYPPK